MTAYDLYRCLDIVLNNYMDSILVKEDPSEIEKKNYDYVKNWLPKEPDYLMKDILISIKVPTGEKRE